MSVVCCEQIRIGFRCFQVLRFVRQVFLIDCWWSCHFPACGWEPYISPSRCRTWVDSSHLRLNPIILIYLANVAQEQHTELFRKSNFDPAPFISTQFQDVSIGSFGPWLGEKTARLVALRARQRVGDVLKRSGNGNTQFKRSTPLVNSTGKRDPWFLCVVAVQAMCAITMGHQSSLADIFGEAINSASFFLFIG